MMVTSPHGVQVAFGTLFGHELHVVDLGVAKHILANILFHLVYTDCLGNMSVAAKLAIVWREILEIYRRDSPPSPLTNLTLSMFCKEEGPFSEFPVMSTGGPQGDHRE